MGDSSPSVVALPRRLSSEQRDLVAGARATVKKLARGLASLHGFDFEECVGVGELALTEAVFHYEESCGAPFHVFAFLRVRGEILDTLGKARRQTRLPEPTSRKPTRALGPVASELVDHSDPLRDSDDDVRRKLRETLTGAAASYVLSVGISESEPSAEDAAVEAEERTRLRAALRESVEALSADQKEIVQAVYHEGRQIKDLEGKLGISYRTLRRRHQDALQTLAAALRERGHAPS